jgi:uncharacterized membrane protein
LAVVVAFVLVIISIMVWYVDHIGRSLRVSALIELVGTDTRKLLDALYIDHGVPPASDDRRFARRAPARSSASTQALPYPAPAGAASLS